MTDTEPRRCSLAEQTLLFGAASSASLLPAELDARGWRRLVVVASGSASRSGLVRQLLEGPLARFEVVGTLEVRARLQAEAIERAGEALAGTPVDALLAVGGGSVSDAAKCLDVVLTEGGRLDAHCYTFEPPDRYEPRPLEAPKIPIVALPTTLSGAEVSGGAAVFSAAGAKRGLWDQRLAARVACFDADIFARTPVDVLVTTGMNALHHCVEGLASRTANPVAEALELRAATALAAGLRGVARDGRLAEHCEELASGAALAGLGLLTARVGVGHAICHVLGGTYGIAHGVANAIALPAAMRFNAPAAGRGQRLLAAALGEPDAPGGPVAVVARLRREIGAPERLRDVGAVAYEDLDDVAAATMRMRGTYFNARPVTVADVRRILEWMW